MLRLDSRRTSPTVPRRMRIAPVAVTALALAVVGPRLTAPTDREAGEPFAYEPPEGFVEAKDAAKGLLEASGDRTWVHQTMAPQGFAPKISLTHVGSRSTVEEADLAKAVAGMPEAFEQGGVTWKHRRHEVRIRPDGARVGLIEGDCVKRLEEEVLPGLPAEQHFRAVQLLFPDDRGTSVVKAYYGSAEATTWEPLVEATIGKARGVATRVPPPPPWLYGAWGLGGAVLGWLGASLLGARARQAPAREAASEPTDGKAASEEA